MKSKLHFMDKLYIKSSFAWDLVENYEMGIYGRSLFNIDNVQSVDIVTFARSEISGVRKLLIDCITNESWYMTMRTFNGKDHISIVTKDKDIIVTFIIWTKTEFEFVKALEKYSLTMFKANRLYYNARYTSDPLLNLNTSDTFSMSAKNAKEKCIANIIHCYSGMFNSIDYHSSSECDTDAFAFNGKMRFMNSADILFHNLTVWTSTATEDQSKLHHCYIIGSDYETKANDNILYGNLMNTLNSTILTVDDASVLYLAFMLANPNYEHTPNASMHERILTLGLVARNLHDLIAKSSIGCIIEIIESSFANTR
jgi:hypothetical protein